MNQSTPDALAHLITNKRKAAGITQNHLADTTDIARTTFVRRIRRNDWTLIELYRIATALDTTPSALMAEAEQTEAAA